MNRDQLIANEGFSTKSVQIVFPLQSIKFRADTNDEASYRYLSGIASCVRQVHFGSGPEVVAQLLRNQK